MEQVSVQKSAENVDHSEEVQLDRSCINELEVHGHCILLWPSIYAHRALYYILKAAKPLLKRVIKKTFENPQTPHLVNFCHRFTVTDFQFVAFFFTTHCELLILSEH